MTARCLRPPSKRASPHLPPRRSWLATRTAFSELTLRSPSHPRPLAQEQKPGQIGGNVKTTTKARRPADQARNNDVCTTKFGFFRIRPSVNLECRNTSPRPRRAIRRRFCLKNCSVWLAVLEQNTDGAWPTRFARQKRQVETKSEENAQALTVGQFEIAYLARHSLVVADC